MSSILFYDPNAKPIAGAVSEFRPTVDVPPSSGTFLVNPDLSQVSGENRYWKVVDGVVLPMSDVERYKLDNAGVERNSSLLNFMAEGSVQSNTPLLKSVQRYIMGAITLYSMKSVQKFDFNISKGGSAAFTIDGANITLSLSKTGTLSINKPLRNLIKYQIDTQYI